MTTRGSDVGGAAPRPGRPAGRAAAILVAALILPAALPALAGCGRGPAAPADQVFRFRLREDPPTLDPAKSTDQLSQAVLFPLFRGLVEVDPGTLAIRPAVAASWSVSPDRRTYTFALREDARFHNGRRVTARDVEYSFLRTLRKETAAPWRWVLEPIEGATDFIEGRSPGLPGLSIPDDRTVVLRLARPFSPFLGQLSTLPAAIVPREVYDDPAERYLEAPVGCGPFRFSRWERGNFVELKAFDGYYGGRPALDRVVVRIIENKASALQEYYAGGLDSMDELPDEQDTEARARLKDEIRRYPFMGTGYIGLNHALPPFKGNPRLRQAINYAIDKKYLWEVLLPGSNVPANGLIPPGIPGHDPGLPGYPHDEERARRLLAEAGHPGGRGLGPIAFWFNTSEGNRRIALQIQADLRTIGVEVALREVDWAAYLKAVEGTRDRPGEAQMWRAGWYLDYPDADVMLRPLLHSANRGPGGNHCRYRNPEVDRLLERALELDDPAERAAIYRTVERIAVMDDAVMLFLNYYDSFTLFKPHVKGIVLTPLGEFRIPLERLRIERDGA